MNEINEATISQYLLDTFAGVHAVDAWGDTFFYYNPERDKPDELYFATLKSNDDEYDNLSSLNRPSVFRFNIGIGKESYQKLFGARSSRHRAEAEGETRDYSVLDQLLPHPVYGHLYWVSVLNPSKETFEAVKPLLAEAYALAVAKHTKRS